MKILSINIKHILLIMTIGIASVGGLRGSVSQDTVIVPLADDSGYTTDQEKLAEMAYSIQEVFPPEYQSQFKVIEAGFYVYNSLMNGRIPAIWQDMKQQARSISNNYILIAKEVSKDGGPFKIRIDISLPKSSEYPCVSDLWVEGITEIIESKINLSINSGEDFTEAILEGLNFYSIQVNHVYNCCTGTRGMCSTDESLIQDILDVKGYFNYNNFTVHLTNENTPTPEIIISYEKNLKVKNRIQALFPDGKFNLTASLESFKNEVGNNFEVQYNINIVNQENAVPFKWQLLQTNETNASGYSEEIVVLNFEGSEPKVYYKINLNNDYALKNSNNNNRMLFGKKAIIKWFFKRVSTNPSTIVIGVAVDYAISTIIELFSSDQEDLSIIDAFSNTIWNKGWEGFLLSVANSISDSPVTDFILDIADYFITTPYDEWDPKKALSTTFFGVLTHAATNFKSVSDNTKKLFADFFSGNGGFKLFKSIFANRKLVKAWEAAIARPLYRTDAAFLEKLSDLLDPSVVNKFPNGQVDLDNIVAALVHPHSGTSHAFLKNVAEHLDDVKHLVNNFHDVEGFDKVVTALKNPNFFAQDGASHLLTKLKTFNASDVAKLEGKIVDADNLDGICTNCLFDIQLSSGKKLELKSYSESTIGNIANSSKFINQFKAYLADASNIDAFEYIFNGTKTQDLSLIQNNFKELFKKSNYSIYDEINAVNPGLWNSLGIDDISDFASMVDNLDPALYKFINILN